MAMDFKYTLCQVIIILISSMIFKQIIISCDQPAPSVEVSFAPNETMKSLKNITYIVLPLG